MAEKSLKISVKSDLRDGSKLSRFVDDLHKKVEKFSKVLSNLSMGGGERGPGGQPRPGTPTLAKQLEGDKKAMESMGREVDNLQRRFQNLGNTVQSAGSKMHQAATGRGGLVDQFGRPLGPSGGGGGGPVAPGGGGPGGPGGPGAPGGGGGLWQRLQQPVGGIGGSIGRMAGWGTILANLKEGILGAPQRAIDWASLGGRAGSESAGSMGSMGARMLGGDLGPASGLMRLTGGGHGNRGFEPGDFEKIIEAAPGKATMDIAKRVLSPNMFKAWNEAGQLSDPHMRAAAMNKILATSIQTGAEMDPMMAARQDYARAQAPGRVGFARRFGGDFSAGTALGNTTDPAQVMATVGAVLDVLGTGDRVQKITKLVSEATRMGLSNEAVQTMLRASEIGGGGLMDHMLRSGLSRPMMGRAGAAAAGMAGASLLRLNPDTFAGGFTSGGASTDELTMRQREAGRDFLNQVTTGGLDDYQQTVNMALASKKKGRSVITAGVLGKMNLNELMQAAVKPTPEQLSLNIGKDDAADQLNAVVNSLGARAFSEGDDTTPAIRRLMEATQGEGGIMGAAKRYHKQGKAGEGALTELNAGLVAAADQPVGSRPLDYLVGAQAGGPQGAKAGETRGSHGTALEATMAGSKELERDFVSMRGAMKDLAAVVKTFPDTVTAFQDAMKATSQEEVYGIALSFAGLGEAMGKISKNGEAAVDVMKTVEQVVARIAGHRSAVARATHEQMLFSGGGDPTGGGGIP